MARAKTPRDGSIRKQVANVSAIDAPESKKNSSPVDLQAEIRRRAYELYQERGCTPGHEDEDWLIAEREVLARFNQQQTA